MIEKINDLLSIPHTVICQTKTHSLPRMGTNNINPEFGTTFRVSENTFLMSLMLNPSEKWTVIPTLTRVYSNNHIAKVVR